MMVTGLELEGGRVRVAESCKGVRYAGFIAGTETYCTVGCDTVLC
jgi:hypothetical protein